MIKYSIIIGFKNREIQRVKNCLLSLSQQKFIEFEVLVVNYGSEQELTDQLKNLFSTFPYNFILIDYKGQGKFWNRSHCLNIGSKQAKGTYLIFGDIDLIYPTDFLQIIDNKAKEDRVLQFQYTFLQKGVSIPIELKSEDDKIGKTDNKVSGMCVVSRNIFFQIGGFDEFYMIWGVEDSDLFERLSLLGLERFLFKKQELVLYHIWHPLESSNAMPTIWYIEMIKYYYEKRSVVNRNLEHGWGQILEKRDLDKLKIIDKNSNNVHLLSNAATYDYYNSIIDKIVSTPSGKCLSFVWKPLRYKGKIRIINEILKTFNFSESLTIKVAETFFGRKYISRNDLLSFIQWYIGIGRDKISDYYVSNDKEGICFSLILK